MGIRAAGQADLAATVLAGSFVAATAGGPVEILGDFNVTIGAAGVFTGTVVIEQSSDGGNTWVPELNRYTNTAISFTAPGAIQMYESEPGVMYRARCSVFTAGPISWRISAGANRGYAADQHITG